MRRARAVMAKRPQHLLRLGQWYGAQLVQRAGHTWAPAGLTSQAFLAQLELPDAQQAVQAHDGPAARRAAAEHFRRRVQPRFCFDPQRVPELAQAVPPEARAAAIAQADDVLRLTFRFRGESPVTFEGAVDWFYCPPHNLDWSWELNRHAYFVSLGQAYAYTGEARYVQSFRALMLDWLKRNPPAVGAPNWSSVLEVGYRLNAWVWAYHYCLPALDDEALLACLRGLWLHGRFLAANLEYPVANNHLWLESKALALIGLILPEAREARAWRREGLRVLWQQIRQQVRPDGVHSEQASMYHQIVASELLELLVLLDNNRLAAPPDIRERFIAMLTFEQALTKPNGEIPLLGDSALADSYHRFSATAGGAAWLGRPELSTGPRQAALETATWWLLGPERAQRLRAAPRSVPVSQAFQAGGYYVMRGGGEQDPAYLVFDCGPFGDPTEPGHGHADALSFELYASGRTLILDPGVYSYHRGSDWRNFFRGTAAHNTVVVDGANQSELVGQWHVLRPAQASVQAWVTAPQFDFIEGTHDGYRRLREPVTHRRQIFFVKPDYWVVVDWLEGVGHHTFDLYFHLASEAEVVVDAGTVRADYAGQAGLLVCSVPADQAQIVVGSLDPIQGWVSRYSGEKQPAPTVRYSRSVAAPTRFCTVLYPFRAGPATAVKVASLPVHEAGRAADERAVFGLTIATESWTDYLVVDSRDRPALKAFAHLHGDGQVIYARCRPGTCSPEREFVRGGELRWSSPETEGESGTGEALVRLG
jgi:uncharacterized heparinase superfamily protein